MVTSNKGPVALAGRELVQLAGGQGLSFRYEGTVLSGTPALNLALETLAGVEIKEARGILNGTTNYILSEMEEGKGYRETLKRAQDLGYAEAKPDADVEGWDALAKILIIANLLMGGNLKVSDVARTGITGISLQDVEAARQNNERWKLIARAWREAGQVRAKVSPAIRPGMLVIYHAWENYQFQGGVGYQNLIPSPLNPVELSGGQHHLRPMAPCLQPSHTDRDTRVEVARL